MSQMTTPDYEAKEPEKEQPDFEENVTPSSPIRIVL